MLYYDCAVSFHTRREQSGWKQTDSTDGGGWFGINIDYDHPVYKGSLGDGCHAVVIYPDDNVLLTKHEYIKGSTTKWTAGAWSTAFATLFASRITCGVSKTGYTGLAVRDFTRDVKSCNEIYAFTPMTVMTPRAIHNLAIIPRGSRYVGSKDIYSECQQIIRQLLALKRIGADDKDEELGHPIRDRISWKDIAKWQENPEQTSKMLKNMFDRVASRRGYYWRKGEMEHHELVQGFRTMFTREVNAALLWKYRKEVPLYTAHYDYDYAPLPMEFTLQNSLQLLKSP